MPSITISVPEPLRDWVEQRVEAGRFGTASEYLAELIRRDREDDEERDTLVAALKQGEASGISGRQVPEILAALRRESGGAAG